MSRFLHSRFVNMVAYVPGEQPKDKKYIKLNANETSMAPSKEVLKVLSKEKINKLGFYGDPDALELRQVIADTYDVAVEEIMIGNGSDEVLSFINQAYFDTDSKICYPDITYGFYDVYAKTYGIDGREIPLKEDFTIDIEDYIHSDRHVILANPNAPTGYVLPVSEIERLVASNPNRLVVIDEAYVDYGNETCIPLIKTYNNLIVVHTMSKSRNLAGAHIGYAIACKELIEDINGIKFAFNPYNMSEVTQAIGIAAVKDRAYHKYCTDMVIENREYTKIKLRDLGFTVLDTKTNFVFVTHPLLDAKEYNYKLREHGILARHFEKDRISNYLRITIGTREEMDAVIEATKVILQRLVA